MFSVAVCLTRAAFLADFLFFTSFLVHMPVILYVRYRFSTCVCKTRGKNVFLLHSVAFLILLLFR